MRWWVGTIATSIVITISTDSADAGMLYEPARATVAAQPFATEAALGSAPPRVNDILPPSPADMAFPSLGVMTLLEAPTLRVSDVPRIDVDIRSVIVTDSVVGPREEYDLPLELPSEASMRPRGGFLDVLFVIPTPGASALMMLGCCGALRRRR